MFRSVWTHLIKCSASSSYFSSLTHSSELSAPVTAGRLFKPTPYSLPWAGVLCSVPFYNPKTNKTFHLVVNLKTRLFFLTAHTSLSLFLSFCRCLSLPLPVHTLVCHTHTHTHTWPERISSAFKLSSRFLCLSLLLPLFQWGAAATRVWVGRVPTLISTGVLLGALTRHPPSPFLCLS